MGLDMYLYRKSYVKNWDHMIPAELHKVTVSRGDRERTDIKPERIAYVIEQVAYWRKANQIHNWFVDNCQGGIDDCRDAYVSREQLQELVALCKKVLDSVETVNGPGHTGTTIRPGQPPEETFKDGTVVAQKEIAESLLPTQGGFFFGGTDYDEFYLQDVRDTIDQLEPLLAIEGDEATYEYRSSW